ncbi:MAG: MATE family efflux transporter [Lachnospiraceae bacterium]|nr:MATE family efflux transporter [Lachnospiraceae bacterium]
MNKDLTEGNPRKVLWMYTIPLLGSVVFQQLYNLADSLVSGKFVGEHALAAVGNASEITLIYTAFAFGCNIGCSVVVSQLFGSKRWKELKTSVTTAFLAFGVLCAALMLFGFLCTRSLLLLMNTPEEILNDSLLYLKIYTAGMPFVFFYNVATGIFSAMGDSKTLLYFLAFSSTSNILVDILFVKAFSMGVAGVAWATFLCQGVSCILAVIALAKRLNSLPYKGKYEFFSGEILIKITKVAIPSILQQSFISVGNIIIQSIINNFGASVIAGYTAAIRLNTIAISLFTAAGNGMSTFTAQNVGAQKYERIRQGYRGGLLLDLVMAVPCMAAFLIFGRFLVGIFMQDPTGSAMATGIQFLRFVTPFYPIISVKIMTDGILRGSGAVQLFMISTFADLLLRVLLAAVLAPPFGIIGVWSSWPVGWTIGTGLSVLMYAKGKWKNARL